MSGSPENEVPRRAVLTRALRALGVSDDVLDTVIENIPDMIFVKDAVELRFVLFNRAGEELLGYDRSDLLGKNDYDFFGRAEADAFTRKDREVLAQRGVVDIAEETIHTRGHGTRTLHTKKIPIFDGQGKALYLLGISEDITDRRRAEDETRRAADLEREKSESERVLEVIRSSEIQLRSALENMPHGVLLVDASGIRYANRAAGEIFGVDSSSELHGSVDSLLERFDIRTLSGEPIRRGTTASGSALNGGSVRNVEYHIRSAKGRELYLNVAAAPSMNRPLSAPAEGVTPVAIVTFEDVTAKKSLEKLRDQFLSTAAHELKTPITTIKAYAQLMEMWTPEEREVEMGEAISSINRESDRLNRLIQELLEVSRLELGRLMLRKQSTRILPLIDAQVRHAQTVSHGHRIALGEMPDVTASIDPDRIEQVMANLLFNAVKYSPHGGTITVSGHLKPGRLVVSVSDQGLGIAADKIPHLFERYFQAHTGTPYAFASGMGVGLFICREFVEKHGGRIWCNSIEGKGSRFTFELPLDAEWSTL